MKFQTLRKFQISEKNFEFQFRFFAYFFDQLRLDVGLRARRKRPKIAFLKKV